MKRFILHSYLKPEKVDYYKQLHANAWPGVLDMITKCNLHNYSISIRGNELYTYYEYTGEDYDADMDRMAADPLTQHWWSLVIPLMQPLDDHDGDGVWAPMEEVYHLD